MPKAFRPEHSRPPRMSSSRRHEGKRPRPLGFKILARCQGTSLTFLQRKELPHTGHQLRPEHGSPARIPLRASSALGSVSASRISASTRPQLRDGGGRPSFPGWIGGHQPRLAASCSVDPKCDLLVGALMHSQSVAFGAASTGGRHLRLI